MVITAGFPINSPAQATISTVAHTYPAPNVNIQSILKQWEPPYISNEESCVVPSLLPNAHISEVILILASDIEASSDDLRTELDSYASIVVLGLNSFVFETTGRFWNVQFFRSDKGITKDVPIVDGASSYDCPCTGVVYVLIVINDLYISSMDYNMIPPFIIRAGGVSVNDIPKIYCEYPAVDNHCILFDNSGLWIQFQLNGVFSYFHTRVPTER